MDFDKKPPNCVIKILFAYLQTVDVKKQWVLHNHREGSPSTRMINVTRF